MTLLLLLRDAASAVERVVPVTTDPLADYHDGRPRPEYEARATAKG